MDLHERRVSIARHERKAAGREVRTRERAGARFCRTLHRRADRAALRRVALRVEDDDVRWAHADAERLQGALVRLIGGLARDREALVPALRDLAGGEATEEGEHDPDGDDGPAITRDEVSEACEQAVSFSEVPGGSDSAANVQGLNYFCNCNHRVTLPWWGCGR